MHILYRVLKQLPKHLHSAVCCLGTNQANFVNRKHICRKQNAHSRFRIAIRNFNRHKNYTKSINNVIT